MELFKWVAKIIRILPNLAKAPLSRKRKFLILLTYLKLMIASPFKGKSGGKVKLFDFNIEYFDYKILLFLYEEIFLGNEYAFVTSNKHPIILDCGANIGMATFYFTWLFPEATIVAIEPDPSTFELLARNIKNNRLTNVRLHNVALSDIHGTVDFFTNSLKPGSLRMGNERRAHIDDRVIVKSEPLSHIIDKEGITNIDFLKLDVEGAEVHVIDDLSKNDLLSSIENGVIEYHHRIAGKESSLGAFLIVLEGSMINYQISARFLVESEIKIFQDVMIYFTNEQSITTSPAK